MVLAALSNGSNYLNAFRRDPARSYPLEELLKEIWDFDTHLVEPENGEPIDPMGKPVRAYLQYKRAYIVFPDGSVETLLPPERWSKYPYNSPPDEIPPLPPAGSYSGATPDDLSGESKDPSYVHHLIRDFMFTDATFHNAPAEGDYSNYYVQVPRRYRVESRDLIPGDYAEEDPDLSRFTRGTGPQSVQEKCLVALDDIHDKQLLDFPLPGQNVRYTGKFYQLIGIESGLEVTDNEEAPNWFGVAVPEGAIDFSNIIIYFHASPYQSPKGGWNDNDYDTRGGTPNWKELFGFVDRLGTQLAGAISKYGATPNQIVIIPFMTTALCNQMNSDGTIGSAGIFSEQWYYIVTDIINDLRATLGGG